MPTARQSQVTVTARAFAAGVHLLTASSAIWGLLAIAAIVEGQWRSAFGWMGLSLAIDMVDGSLARLGNVEQVFPDFDGALLDNIVDFLNYVFVPAVFLYHAALLPANQHLIGVVILCLSSSYQFCQKGAKTPDHYFKCFPSYWNVAVFYLFIIGLDVWLNLVVLVLLGIGSFVPIKYVYPSRTRRHRRLTLALTALWGGW